MGSYTTKITFNLDPDLARELADLGDEDQTSVSTLVRQAVKRYLDDRRRQRLAADSERLVLAR